MAKARMRAALAASCLLLVASVASAAPTVDQMLSFRPRQEGIVYTTPSDPEKAACKVELVKGARGSGWVLKDKNGATLRRYYDSNGDNQIDVWSYYLNGSEVYREIDTNFNTKPDQFRWFNAGGSKWGLDLNEDGKIDAWKAISPEEVSQEVVLAVAKKDFARLQALMMTEADLKELPAAEQTRIRDVMRGAPAKFQATLGKVGTKMTDKTRWVRVELAAPQCNPADVSGAKQDLVKYVQADATWECEKEAGDLLLGEMIQVGTAWRLIDAPEVGGGEGPGGGKPLDETLEKLLSDLKKLDDTAPDPSKASPADLARYNVQRADIMEKIVNYLAGKKDAKPEDAEQRDSFARQVADSLLTAVQNNPKDRGPADRLTQMKDRYVKEQPGTNTTAHVVYSQMQAEYSLKMADPKVEAGKVQEEWVETLGKFAQDYPRSEDTPDALMQAGMGSELIGKEAQAKKWYELLVKDFSSSPLAGKAKGAVERLSLDNTKEVHLASTELTSNAPFDLAKLHGKVVVIYYWAQWNEKCAAEFKKLQELKTAYGTKGLEIVCPNLDNEPSEAASFLAKTPAPGVVLFDKGGMNSKLAENYGIQVLPTLFLVNKDGKCASRTVQIQTLEDELKKLLDK